MNVLAIQNTIGNANLTPEIARNTSFGAVLPGLAASRQVIGTELQAHGRTADIDRPLRIESLADSKHRV